MDSLISSGVVTFVPCDGSKRSCHSYVRMVSLLPEATSAHSYRTKAKLTEVGPLCSSPPCISKLIIKPYCIEYELKYTSCIIECNLRMGIDLGMVGMDASLIILWEYRECLMWRGEVPGTFGPYHYCNQSYAL